MSFADLLSKLFGKSVPPARATGISGIPLVRASPPAKPRESYGEKRRGVFTVIRQSAANERRIAETSLDGEDEAVAKKINKLLLAASFHESRNSRAFAHLSDQMAKIGDSIRAGGRERWDRIALRVRILCGSHFVGVSDYYTLLGDAPAAPVSKPQPTIPPDVPPSRPVGAIQPEVIGVLFDIDALGGGFYGAAAYRLLFDAVGRRQIRGVRLFDGDTAATLQLPGATIHIEDARLYCIAVECIAVGSASGTVIRHIRARLAASAAVGLCPLDRRFLLDSAAVKAEPLVFAGAIDSSGVLVGCDTPWVASAWRE